MHIYTRIGSLIILSQQVIVSDGQSTMCNYKLSIYGIIRVRPVHNETFFTDEARAIKKFISNSIGKISNSR